jgi:hypothetical protein
LGIAAKSDGPVHYSQEGDGMKRRVNQFTREAGFLVRYLNTTNRLMQGREELRRLLADIDRALPSPETEIFRGRIRGLLEKTRVIEDEDTWLCQHCQIALCERITGLPSDANSTGEVDS